MSRSFEQVIKRPIALTEKAAMLRLQGGERPKVIFEVARDANKAEIRNAVEALFSVEVADVNTLIQRGKRKRMGRQLAKRRNWKKAIVTLREGSDIAFFDESDEGTEE